MTGSGTDGERKVDPMNMVAWIGRRSLALAASVGASSPVIPGPCALGASRAGWSASVLFRGRN